MNTRSHRTGWAGCSVVLVALGLGLSLARTVPAQEPADQKKIYTNKTVFSLPIKIAERARADLQEVGLYVKQGAGEWQLKETALPTQSSFSYRATQDGEYWFSVVTVDKQGKATPADVSREPPGLMIVVDTQPPTVEVRPVGGPNGEPCLRCFLQDSNPDYQTVKLSYHAADQSWQPLEPLPNLPGVFRAPSPEILTGVVRVSAMDLAKNPTIREVSLRDAQAPPAATSQRPAAVQSLPPAPGSMAQNSALPASFPVPPKNNYAGTPGPMPGGNPPPAETTVARPAIDSQMQPVSLQTVPNAPVQNAMAATPERQLISTTHATVDYRIDHVGPSGVSKVELWVTPDQGRSWQRLADDTDLRSPAEVDLPGEGLYGVRLVVTNGNGFGGSPPAQGDTPTCWIEVDTTKPFVQMRDIDPVVKGGAIDIRWTASDKNLGPEPIQLAYATRREGPWLPIGRGLKNDGSYRWSFPRDAGSQFFVRLEVTDLAGNTSRCEPATPVVLDMTEPRAVVVGVSGTGPRPTAPIGN